MQKSLKLMIVEDHPLLRQGLKALLKDYDFPVIYEASNGKQAIEDLKVIQPDVVLLDLEMPVMNGIEALEIIKKKYPPIHVIVLTGHFNEAYLNVAIKSGADGFLPKNCNIEELVAVIENIPVKKPFIYPNIQQYIPEATDKQSPRILMEQRSLTPMEIKVLISLCEGKTRKEIAEKHNTTTRTITFHTGNIYEKTKLSTKAELCRYASRNGFIPTI